MFFFFLFFTLQQQQRFKLRSKWCYDDDSRYCVKMHGNWFCFNMPGTNKSDVIHDELLEYRGNLGLILDIKSTDTKSMTMSMRR